ncbi:hypothetical protein OGAPHI_001546 [Ogataea philodendri]|uniref:Striatin N-terminal domain-containing protein n=1 Tax=Ogataea philodendri TaxID=1378263 RepID=A0A9P8T8P1_9ASCO|nr:uncharacterized protein OGAPHI_001546 [Ogataea philodendri]KAH3669425.1 hypothetical protein OGAPHI_001546 [Ogataea philodendri]
MEQGQFGGLRPNGGADNDANELGPGGSAGSHYTLPGIMQYLQSQFTLVERNRMMNDLEKSALKLRIVELESERNTLRLENDKLKARVEALESSGPGYSNGKGKSVDESEVDQLLSISSVDVTKLVKAKQFLKTATNEILYLLKSPSVELSDNLNITKDGSHELYIHPESHLDTPSEKVSSPSSADYLDMAISLQANPKSTEINEKNLFASTSKPSDTVIDKEPVSVGILVDGLFFGYVPDHKVIKVWTDLDSSPRLKHTVLVGPTKVNEIAYSSGVLTVLGDKQVLAYKLDGPEISLPLATYEWDDKVKSFDFVGNRLAAIFDSKVEILKLDVQDECFELVSSIDHNLEDKFLKAKFINLDGYDLAILSSKSLILRNTKQQLSNKLTSMKMLNVATFESVMMTQEYVVLKDKASLYSIWFKDFVTDRREFPELSSPDSQLGCSLDNPSQVFILSNDKGEKRISYYQWYPEIFRIASNSCVVDKDLEWICLGQLGAKKGVVGVSSAGLTVFNN